jgi:hypothetical protein
MIGGHGKDAVRAVSGPTSLSLLAVRWGQGLREGSYQLPAHQLNALLSAVLEFWQSSKDGRYIAFSSTLSIPLLHFHDPRWK